MDGAGAYIAFDVLESLKQFRDSKKCLDGLRKLRAALQSEDGLRVLAQLAEATPNLEELMIIWDHQVKAQDQAVAINLMLTITDVFTVAAHKGAAPRAATAATALAAALLARRLRSVYSHLASQQRSRATPALLMLAALASLGPASARELVRLFDFSLSALPHLARPARPRKGETTSEVATRQRQEWAAQDPARRPPRAAFVALGTALLRAADAQLLPEVVRLRPLMSGVLHQLSSDPPTAQIEVLKALQRRVMSSSGAGVALGPAAKVGVFLDVALAQLAAVAAAGEDEDESGDGDVDGDSAARRHASDLAFSILHALCVDSIHGMCADADALADFRTAAPSGAAAALGPGPRRLLRWAQRLRPSESARHGQLLRAAAQHDPALAAALLLALPFSMEPTATGRWLVHAGLVGDLLQAVSKASVGLVELAERGLPPPEGGSRAAAAALRVALPPCLPRAALSRGVQHGNALVRHAVLCLLGHMLSALEALLAEAEAATAALPPTAGPSLRAAWDAATTSFRQAARSALPDLQPVVAQLHLALAGGNGSGSSGAAMAVPNVTQENGDEEATDNVENSDVDMELSPEESKKLNAGLISAALQTLRLWRRCLPGALAEGNVDPEKLISEDLSALPALHQLQFLRLLDADASTAAAAADAAGAVLVTQAGGAGPGPALLSALRLLAATEQPDVRSTAAAWAARRLTATGLFQTRPSDALIWVDLIGSSGNNATPGFLCDAVGLVLRRPAEFFSLLPAGTGAASSLLAVCALRQVVRVLGSEKKSQEEKAAVSGYVAAAAALTVMASGGSGGASEAAAAADALLHVLASEASRAEEAPANVAGKRKRNTAAGGAVHALLEGLGPAAAPLTQLTAWLQTVAAVGGADNEEDAPKKKKKSKKEKAGAGDDTATALQQQQLPWELFPGCLVNGVDDLNDLPLCQLPLAALRLCQTNIDVAAAVEAAAACCVASSPQHAPLVAAQALFLTMAPAAEQAMCSVVQGAVGAAADASPADALSSISLCCSSPVLAHMSDPALVEWILATGARLGTDYPSSAEACRPAVAHLLSEVYQASQTGFSSPPTPRLCALLPAAVAAARGSSQAAPAAAALGQIFDQAERSAGIDAAWIAVAGSGVVKLAESGAEGAEDAVCRACAAAAGMLAAPGREGPACALLSQILSIHTWRRCVLEVIGPEGAAAALRACVAGPSPDTSALACALLESSAEARTAFEEALNGGPLLEVLFGVGEKPNKKKMKEQDAGPNFAALLPALTTFLERQGGVKDTSSTGVKVAEVVVDQILWWAADVDADGGRHTDAFNETLRLWAGRCLPYVLSLASQPSDSTTQKTALKALKELTSGGAWALDGGAAEKASVVDSLLRHLLHNSSTGWNTAGALVPVAQALITALAAAFKIKRPSTAQQATERTLLHALDASFNDAVAALPTAQRQTSEFAAVAVAVCGDFGTAVLRRRAEDPAAMRALRRLAAALLPAESGDDDNEITAACPAAAAAASELFQRTVGHSHFLPAMKSAKASPPALPAEAAALPLPLESLLAVADADAGPAAGDDPSAEILIQEESSGNADSRDSQVKRELCMLLETLLDVEETFRGRRAAAAELAAAETALLPVTMAAYGGSMSAVDRAAWDLARTLNLRAWQREGGGGGAGAMAVESDDDENEAEAEGLDALLNGPLSSTCFAWGPGAVAAAAAIASEDEPSPVALQALQARLPLDPRRAALAVTHFPERRALFGSFVGSIDASNDGTDAAGDLPPELPTHPAAYDPSFLIPFVVATLRRHLLPPRAFVQSALASVCLRATAAEDPGLRALAYEALGLLSQQLELKAGSAARWPAAGSDQAAATTTPGLSGEGASGGDFRERAQVAALLGWVRVALPAPFTRLPAVHALFAAEAALLACHPAHAMYAPVAKARLRCAALDLTLVPLFRRAILSGSADARAERTWLLRLLRAGLRSSADAHVYLRQFAPQLAMSLADWPTADAGAARAALGVVAAAAAVPRAARELVERAGLVGWLAGRAAAAAAAGASAPSPRGAAAAFSDAETALGALITLTQVRAVVGRDKGSARAAEDFAQGCRVLLCTLGEVTRTAAAACAPIQAAGLARVWAVALQVCCWTAGAAAGASVPFLAPQEADAAATAAAAVAAKASVAAGAEGLERRVREAAECLVAACAAQVAAVVRKNALLFFLLFSLFC